MTSSCVGRFARACAVLVTASAVVAGLMPAGASSSASAGGTTSTVITQDVTSSQTWTRLGSPYLISSPIYVKSGAVLTIEPGVVVKFVPGNDSGGSNVQGLQVADGVLAARGTSEAPIVFTSVHDDTAGGDSDATNPRAPLAGDWMGLSFGGSGALEGASLLEHVSVRYAGWAGAAGCPYGGAIGVSGRGSLHVLRTEVVDTYATAVSVQKPVDGGTAATFEQLYVARAACGVRAVAGVVENSRIDDSVSVGWSTVNADGAALRYSWVGVPDPLGPSSTPMRASYSIYQTQLTDRSGIDFYNNNFFVRESNTYTGTNGPPMDLRWNWYSPSPTPLGACISDQDKPQLTYDASTYDPSCPTRFRSNGYRDAVQPFLPPPGLPPVGPSAAPYSRMDREAARGCAGCSFFHNEFQVLKAGPVNTATGQAMERRTDVSIPGPGVPAVWSRTYNGDDASSGPLGEGWSTDFTGTLTQTSDREVKVVEPTGAVLRFTRQGDGTYLPAPGIRAALVKQGDGTWRLTSRSAKRVWTYDAAGRLSGVSSLIGPAGLGVRLAYESGRLSRITDAVGRWMDLTYGATGAAEGKVTAVTTSDGRVVSYGYATVAGRPHLVSSTSPAGRVTTWSYDVTSGKLTGFTKPDGRSETDTYDAVTGRISKQVGPDGGTWTFDWTPSTKVSDGEGSGVATSTDPDGNVTKETYSGYVLQSRADGEGGVTRYAYDDDLRVASVTDPAGGVSSMTYDDRGNVLTRTTTFDATHAVTETWTYNGMDQPLTSTNGENETTSYRYNAGGLLADVVDPLDHTTHTDYNGLGLPTTITTPMGRATTMSYDALGNLVARTSPAGGTTRYEYTSAGLVGRTIAPRGNLRGATPADQERFSTWRTYDADGVLTTVTSPDDTTTAYTPDAQGNPVQAVTTDAAGQVIQKVDWTRNSAGEVLTRTRRNPTGAGQRVESFTYTPGGLLDTATDVLGAVTDNDYDHNHNLTRSTLTADGVARVTTYSYDAADRLVSTSDPTGAVDATRYDLAGRAVSVTAPSGAVTTFAYDDAGRLTSSAEQYDGGGTTTQTWDKAGRLIGRKLPGASAGWTYGYNDDGQMTSKTSPSGASVWSWTYTGDGQVDKATLPAGAAFITDYDYTADNLLKSVLDAEGGRTDYTYDPLGRVATATVKVDASRNTVTTTRYNATGTVKDVTVNGTAVLTYGYNGFDDLVSSRNARGNTTTYATNAAGQVLTATDPLDRVRSYRYDQAGELTQLINPSGSSVVRTYDRAGRLTGQDPSDAAPETFTYTDGRMASFTDATGTTTLGYNGRDQLTTVDGPGSDDYAYAYNTDATLASRALPASGTIRYGYDTDGRVTSQTFDGQQVTYGYNLNGWPTKTLLPTTSGRVEVHTYDKAGRVASTRLQTTAATPATVTKHVYTRNAAGLPIRITRTGTETGAAVSTSDSYTYNARGWLTRWCQATTSCTGTAANRVAYGYDAVGNTIKLNRVGSVGDAGTITRAYDAADQLTTTTRSGGTNPGTVSSTWTLDGQSADLARTYDAFGRLAGKTGAGGTRVTYAYTAQGNRARATTSAGTRTLSWDVNNAIPMLAVTSNGSVTAAQRYTPDGSILASRHPAAAYPVTWYAHDGLGSVTDTLGAAGSQLRAFTYDPWGLTLTNRVRTSGALQSSFGYTGAWRDPGESDYHLRARDYTPALGAFAAPDPVAASPELTTYQYAGLAPTLYTDPTGECPWCAVAGAVAGGIIGGAAYAVTHRDEDFSWSALAGATAGGAVAGGVSGLTLGLGAGVAGGGVVGGGLVGAVGAGAGAGAVGGAAGAVTDLTTTSLLDGQGLPSAEELWCSTLGGAFGGAAGGALGGGLGYGGAKLLNEALRRWAANAGRTVAMGRNMVDRVIPYAQKNGYDWYKGTPGWVPRGAIEKVSPRALERTDLWFNKRWIKGEMRNGSKIVDIGEPPGYPPSIFYSMERQQVSGYWNYFQDFQP